MCTAQHAPGPLMLVAPSCSEMPVCTDQMVEDLANRHIFPVYHKVLI